MITDTPRSVVQPVLDLLRGEIALLDERGYIMLANRAWRERVSGGAMVRGQVGDDYLLGCEPGVAADVRAVLDEGGADVAFDYPGITPGGQRWYSVRFAPFMDAGRRGVLVTHTDITERMQAALDRSESDQTLESLIDASPLAIFVLDAEHRVTRWNPAAERMFGWSEAEVLGRLNPVVPPERLDEFLARNVLAPAGGNGQRSFELRRQRKDGTLIDVTISHATLRKTNGEPRGTMAIIGDITARKRAEEQRRFLTEATDALAASLDYEETLSRVVHLSVPRMADTCTVHLVDDDGSIRRLAVAHHDPLKQHLVEQLKDGHHVPTEAGWGTAHVIYTGQPEIIQWTDEPRGDESEHVRLLFELGMRSIMIVPLISRERAIGALVFIHGDSGRVYSQDDLDVAQQLAGRAASAIDNARLYREAREAESLYRAIIEHVPAITYTARADDLTAITYISSQTRLPKSMFNRGVIVDEHSWTSRLHPDDAERVKQVMDACSASGERMEVEYRIVYPDDEVVWRLDQAQLTRDEGGRPLHWQGIVVDITERKQAEALLDMRARQQSAVAELGRRAIGDVDFEALVRDAASMVSDILDTEFVTFGRYDPSTDELTIEVMLGVAPDVTNPRTFSARADSLMSYTLRCAGPVIIDDLAMETRFVPWSGMVEHGVTSGLSVVAPGPRTPYGVLLAATRRARCFTDDDINFLQSVANLLAATIEHSLDDEQIRFQAHLLSVISQAVIATDPDGRITYWNRYAEELYGWTSEEVLGRQVVDVTPSETTRAHAAEIMQRLAFGEGWSGELLLRRRDGTEFPGWTTVTPLLGDDGRALGMVGVSTDISERKRAHAEREQLLRDLGERVKELTVLHRAAALFDRDDTPLDLILCELADMLPGAMQAPESAVARVSVGGHWAASSGYRQTPWSIGHEFPIPGGGRGTIEVAYIDPAPHGGQALFLSEEVSLLRSLAEMFGAFLERIDGQAKLRASEARIRAATEGTLDAFGILEIVRDGGGEPRDYRFIEVNARAEVLLRRTREKLLGRTLTELFLPEQAAMFTAAFNHVTATGETIEREVEVPREGGSFWMHFQAVPLHDGVAAFASETTERRRLEAQLVHQAFHDALTGLPNRALFIDRVDHARGRVRLRQEGVAVLYLDLDNFKIINDSLGHAAGDELLIAVSRRLLECVGPVDTVARLGGDEFAILLEDLSDWGAVPSMAESIVAAFQRPFNIYGREVFTTPSVGVAIATSQDATASDLLRDADAAMYRAKRNGKARVEVFDPSLMDGIVQRFELEHDLRRAIERGEFAVYYQPIVRLSSGETACMEALVRWEHPRRGLLAPAHFIPIAEETGLIVPIGNLVLREACAQTVAWNRQRPVDRQQKISVNLSRRQFHDPALVEQIAAVLDETGLPPDLLYLEITESLMIENEAAVRETLQRLRGLGVHLAVDDFGTGYSALGSLRQFPVEVVKIDRVFVAGIETNEQDAVMLAGIIDLAHALNLRVVAEGVETAGARDLLRRMGCDLAQGFLFAQPLPASALPSVR